MRSITITATCCADCPFRFEYQERTEYGTFEKVVECVYLYNMAKTRDTEIAPCVPIKSNCPMQEATS